MENYEPTYPVPDHESLEKRSRRAAWEQEHMRLIYEEEERQKQAELKAQWLAEWEREQHSRSLDIER